MILVKKLSALFLALIVAIHCQSIRAKIPATNDPEVDVIEVNSIYDLDGNLHFRQAIAWDHCRITGQRLVCEWRKIDKQSDYPWQKSDGFWVVRMGHDMNQFFVRSKCRHDTWTTHDPEIDNRNILPVNKRRFFMPPRMFPYQEYGWEE